MGKANSRINAHKQPALQHVLIQTQELIARFPEYGLSPDKLSWMTLDDLIGLRAFLNRQKAEQEG